MKKILIITSTVLILIIAILSILLLNITKTYVKIPTNMKCSKTSLVKNDDAKSEHTDEKYIKINKEQYVTKVKTKSIISYKDKEIYNQIKKYYIENKIDYKYDDKNLKFIKDYNYEEIKDESGKVIYSWYKNYVKVLEQNGYTCK